MRKPIDSTVNDKEINLKINREENPYMPLREMVYSEIRRAILDTELVPGQKITEEILTKQLGVSRTPVREALRKLENEGFLSVYHGKYAEVASIDRTDLIEEYELRELLEGYAAKLAAKHSSAADLANINSCLNKIRIILESVDTEFDTKTVKEIVKANLDFHFAIIDASQNNKLKEITYSLWKTMRMLSTTTLKNREWAMNSLKEHQKIYEAIKDKDTALAERLMKQHINNALAEFTE